ncbi:Quercetin 2,3-dioxygenase [Halomonas sp. THAF12]|uniref:pirin family protein n=1 Tax=Halomonas sp. THAF12 TaxID=2587849 RepID=UPI001267C1CE|nr:pirin family protein [Halomonas sp. THAF12]QFT84369.1 Quercetin 2,3-dioxygenase [Halomonas sp. THAF12]
MTQPIDRRPDRRLRSHPSQDGDGVAIRRLHDFGGGLDPFLMLDELEAAPHDDAIGGFPPHPHRGIQTLTYVLHGGLRHEDHLGHHSSIGPGDAQWMHTGRGIIHGETPFADAEGLHAFQLWLNLAAADKLGEPTYRDVRRDAMSHLARPGARLTALGGDWQATDGERISGPLEALAGRAGVAHLELDAGGELTLSSRATTLLVFVFAGELSVAGDGVTRGELVHLGAGDRLSLTSAAGARALLLAGEPHGEPIAHYGPFVMNHRHELDRALRDYRDGTFV